MAISACSGTGRVSPDPRAQSLWEERQTVLAEFREWDMYARAALRLEGEAYNIGIRWKHEYDGRFSMMLDAPFGQGVFRIDATAADAYQLLLPDGRVFVSTTAEDLLDDSVGWSLPISGLEYWVRGMPSPYSNGTHRQDSGGRARSIRQDGWNIDYLDYFDAGGIPALPRRLKLANESVTLKLAIERWQPSAAEAGDADLFPSFY